MRRASITSVLLSVVLTTSVSACAEGWCGQTGNSSGRSGARKACAQKKAASAAAKHGPCGPVLKAKPGRCGMRGFVPFPFVALRAFEISTPLSAVSRFATPFDSPIIISSIGSPEADRGPPSS
jgi:hypothetical protein